MLNEFDYALLEHAESLGHGEVHIKLDAATGLRAIIVIHNTKQGPALGGCRCIEYPHATDGLEDAMRLARGMSYKAAISGLSVGGGKAVLLKPKKINDRVAYFKAFGRFVNELGGRYITAVDSGVSTADMDAVATQTPYVTTTSQVGGDPAVFTSRGTYRGIEAAVKFKLGKDSLEGIHVAIEGLGKVGYHLARDLHAAKVKLTVFDTNPDAVARCVNEFNATPVHSSEALYQTSCDVFSPCAMGKSVDDNTIPLFKTSIIAGCANNQLSERYHGEQLHKKGILYAPDYVINAGGLIHSHSGYFHQSQKESDEHIYRIYDTLLTIFERAEKENRPTSDVADAIAEDRL